MALVRVGNGVFFGVATALAVFAALAGSGAFWKGTAHLHTVLEALAAVLCAVIGVLALVRYYARPETLFLFVGTAFLGGAALNAYHAVITGEAVALLLPSGLSSLAPWSWIAAQVFIGLMLLLGLVAMRQQKKGARLLSAAEVYSGATLLALASMVMFALVPLRSGYFAFDPFSRPEELMPALLFGAVLVGLARNGGWRESAFESWLIASLIFAALLHAPVMMLSGALYDGNFNAAHVLKLASYVCVMAGILIDMYGLYHQVEESQARVQAVVDAVVEGIITIDSRGRIETFNAGAERVFGYTAAEVKGENVKMLMPEPYHSEHDGYVGAYLHTGRPKIIGIGREVRGKRKDGSEFPLDLAVGAFQVSGEKMFVGVCRDVTERKRDRDEIEAMNKELESFAYSVSHDLRAPLRSINGFSQALVEDYGGALDEGARKYLSRIQGGTQRMGTLIDDLLTLSRATRGEFRREPVDVSALATEIIADLRDGDPGRDIDIEIEPGLRVFGDPRMLRIMLENLISNAWKFTGKAEKPVIALGVTRSNGHRAFFVKDNGAGFDMEYAERLFTPFQRLHSQDEFAGTGIGLATVARVAQRHGGRVWAESESGKGATFYFELGGY